MNDAKDARTTRQGEWVVWIAVVATLAAVNSTASAQDVCIPHAQGVPGLTGPPRWASGTEVRTELDDPRWSGAAQQAFPDLSGSEARFRALREGDELFLTLQALADPSGATPGKEAIYLGLAPDGFAPGSGDTARLVKVTVETDSDGEAQNTPAFSVASFERGSDDAAWSGAPAPTFLSDTRVWVDGSEQTWAVNTRVDVAELSLGAPFKLFYGFHIQNTTSPPPGTAQQYLWPAGSVPGGIDQDATEPDNLAPVDPTLWGTATFGNASSPCTNGITLARHQIGTTNAVSSEIDTTTGNTFFSDPSYNGEPVVAGSIEARFRLANWGSVADPGAAWSDLTPSGADLPVSLSSGRIEYSCVQDATADNQCPQLASGQTKHQCLLVELSGTGTDSVKFARDSAWRNMDFVDASTFSRNAELSIRELEPIEGQARRDMYLYVETRNMPPPSQKPTHLDRKRMLELKRLTEQQGSETPPGNDEHGHNEPEIQRGPGDSQTREAGAQEAGKPSGTLTTSKTVFEKLTEAWPTYEVHVYHDTGETIASRAGESVRLEAQPPFGYFIDHQGDLYGWSHSLEGVDAELEQLTPHFYRISVANNDVAHVKTTIEAVEEPSTEADDTTGKPDTGEEGPGEAEPEQGPTQPDAGIPWWVWVLVGLLVVALIWMLRRRSS